VVTKRKVYAEGVLPDNLVDRKKNAEAVESNNILKEEAG
jgi:hypothetical protein